MDVVPDAGAIRCGVVATKHAQHLTLTQRDLFWFNEQQGMQQPADTDVTMALCLSL